MAGEKGSTESDATEATAADVEDIAGGMPEEMSMDDAADLLSPNIDELLNLTVEDDDNQGGDKTGDTDQGEDQSGAEDEDRPKQRSKKKDQGDDRQSEDDDEAGEGDQGDDQSDEDPEADSAFGLFTKGDDGKFVSLKEDELEIDVEVGGEQQTVSLEELRNGYQRHDDYTRKTQALAQTVAEKAAEATAEREAQLDERAQDLDIILATFGGLLDQTPDLNKLKEQYGGDADRAWQAFSQQQALQATLKKAKTQAEERRQRGRGRGGPPAGGNCQSDDSDPSGHHPGVEEHQDVRQGIRPAA